MMPSTLPASSSRRPRTRTRAQKGQILAIFVLAIFVLTGFIALVIDVSWYWSNSLRVQRAADSAALAGAVDLPGNPGSQATHPIGSGIGDALAEATKNGYTAGSGTTISAQQDSVAVAAGNPNQMDVTISTPVNTFFMRIFGIKSIVATRSSKALFTLPVPMGSPENYYGVFGKLRDATFTNNVTHVMTTTNNNLQGPSSLCSARTTGAPSDCFQPNGASLNVRGFWAAMNTKGIESSQGDAFQSDQDPSGATAPACTAVVGLRSCYDPTSYYNYAIDMPAGSSNGFVYIFDPVFCDTDAAEGTGDGQSSGSLDKNNPPSSWYELWDMNGTPYDPTDDSLIKTTGTKFRDMPYSDTTMGGDNGATECKQTSTAYGDARDYHDNWYLLNPANPLSGGANGHVYRIHTTNSTPPGQTDAVNQSKVGTEQNFALYASASGGTPSIYGLGAMEMYTPIANAGTSQFYLAQIPVAYAGKTLELNLWDAGDTGGLTAKLSVEVPSTTVGVWTPINFNYTANSAASGCSASPSSGTNVSTVTTNSFDSCWLTVDVVIPTTYTAPQSGWWQISYAMTGSGSSVDTTTWTAHILGNPVHLIVP
jgi:Flp pilus assembly protein TadG